MLDYVDKIQINIFNIFIPNWQPPFASAALFNVITIRFKTISAANNEIQN